MQKGHEWMHSDLKVLSLHIHTHYLLATASPVWVYLVALFPQLKMIFREVIPPSLFQRNLQHTNQKNRLYKQISDRDIRSESASCLHWQLGLHFCSLVLTTIILPWYSAFTFSRVHHTQVRMWPRKNVLTPHQENFFSTGGEHYRIPQSNIELGAQPYGIHSPTTPTLKAQETCRKILRTRWSWSFLGDCVCY